MQDPNVFTILGREYRLMTPDVRYPALATSHFLEVNKAHAPCMDLPAVWNTLCVRASNHTALHAAAAIARGYPIEGDILMINGREWRYGYTSYNRGAAPSAHLSLTGDYQILDDGNLAFSGSIERHVSVADFQVIEGEYRPMPVWFFVGKGVMECAVRGAVWVKVFQQKGLK